MALPAWISAVVEAIYFIAAVLFIWGLKRMSSPRTARRGIIWAGIGMAAAILVTFFLPGMHNLGWMIGAIVYMVAEVFPEAWKLPPRRSRPSGYI